MGSFFAIFAFVVLGGGLLLSLVNQLFGQAGVWLALLAFVSWLVWSRFELSDRCAKLQTRVEALEAQSDNLYPGLKEAEKKAEETQG